MLLHLRRGQQSESVYMRQLSNGFSFIKLTLFAAHSIRCILIRRLTKTCGRDIPKLCIMALGKFTPIFALTQAATAAFASRFHIVAKPKAYI